MMQRLIGIVFAVVITACASAGGSGAGRSACGLVAKDSVYLDRGAVYRDCAVDDKAKLITINTRPDFQPTSSDNGCLAAEVEFVVDTAGVPELGSARLVRATTPPFGQAVMAMVPSLKYEPARLGGQRVRQIVVDRRTVLLAKFVVPAGTTPTRSGAQRPPSC